MVKKIDNKLLKFSQDRLKNSTSYPILTQNDIESSIDNYRTRLSSIGAKPEEALDKRNPVEKALNLTPDQNVLFDIFELINRPQQALFSGIKNIQEGNSFGEGLKKGLSGEMKTSGGDLLRNTGLGDINLFTGPLSGENRTLADLLGLGLDIVADPVDLIPAGALVKAGKVAGATSDVNKAAKALDIAKAANDASRIQEATRALDLANDALKTVKDTKYSASLLEAGMQGAVGGTKRLLNKGLTKGAEALDVKTIGKLAKNAGLIEDGTKVTSEMLPTLTKQLTDLGIDFTSKSDALKGAKKFFSKTADYGASFEDNLFNKVSRSDNAIDFANAYGKAYSSAIQKQIENYAKATGRASDDVSKDVLSYISSKYEPTTGMDRYIKEALGSKSGKANVIKGTKEELDIIQKALDKFKSANNITDKALTVTRNTAGTTLSLSGNKKLLSAIADNDKLMKKLSGITYTKGLNVDKFLSDLNNISKVDKKTLTRIKSIVPNDVLDELKVVKDYKNLSPDSLNKLMSAISTKSGFKMDTINNVINIGDVYKSDAAFKELIDNAENGYNEFNKFLKQATGETIDFSDMLRPGYVTNSLTDEGRRALEILNEEKINGTQSMKSARRYNDELYKGSSKTFGGKEYSNQTQQAIEEFSEDIRKTKENAINELNRLTSKSYESDVNKLSSNIRELGQKKAKDTRRFKKRLSDANIKGESANDLVKKYNSEVDDLSDLISDKVLKKAEKANTLDLSSNLLKKSEKYNNKLNKFESARKALDNPNLTAKQYQKAVEKFDKAAEALDKAKADVIFQVAKIDGAVEESFIKEAGNLANEMADKSSRLTKQIEKQTKIRNNARALEEQLNITHNSTINNFSKQQADLRLQLNKLKNMTPEEIKVYNKNIADQIAQKQRVIDVLSSVEGKKLYNETFKESFDAFLNKTTTQAKAMKNYNEVLLQSGLQNDNVVKFFKTGEQVRDITGNMVEMSTQFKQDALKYLDDMKNFMPENSKLLKQFKKELASSKTAYIDKDALELLKVNKRATESEAKVLIDTIDGVNNFFKKTSTLTPGFHLRNITGNASNMWLSGMSSKDIAAGYARATKLSKSDYMIDLVKKKAAGTLSSAEAKDFKIIEQFVESGALGSSKDIRDLGDLVAKATGDEASKNLAKKVWDGIFSANAKANQKMDNLSRMALLSHASENSKYITKLGANDAIDAMRKVLFDPQNLSPFEKKYIKRAIPFYTFTKQNLMFQMKNIVNNTSRYNKLVKAYNKMYESVGEGNYRQYQKENFETPIKIGDKTLSLKTNLPVGDLGEYLSNPIQRLVSSATPLLKAPVEYTTGVDLFTGQDISDQSPIDALIKGAGLTNASKAVKGIGSVISGESESIPASLMPSVFRYSDPEKITSQRQYEELMRYQYIIKSLKKQGVDVPTMQDLKAYNKLETSDKSYDELTPNQKETLKEYNKYLEYVQYIKAQGLDVPTIAELNRQANSSLKAVQKRRDSYNKRRSQ